MKVVFEWRSWPYIHPDELADLVNHVTGTNAWGSLRMKRWLMKVGATQKIGGRVVTTSDDLRDRLPRLWDRLVFYMVAKPDLNEQERSETNRNEHDP